MLSNLASLVQKAQQLIDPTQSASPFGQSTPTPSKSTLFQTQFRLPKNQDPLSEIAAELSIAADSWAAGSTSGETRFRSPSDFNETHSYTGYLYLSDRFLCFSTHQSSFLSTASLAASTVFAGQTYGSGPSGHGFVLPLCAIRRVERVKTLDEQFLLAIATSNSATGRSSQPGPPAEITTTLNLQLVHSPQYCHRFCDVLKRCLRLVYRESPDLSPVISSCYSERIVAGFVEDDSQVDPVTAGLGLQFGYPGNARMLRDTAKTRLWREYMRFNGRNATIVRLPTLHKLIRVGLPNRLRGEIWELTSGAFYARISDPDLYQRLLRDNAGKTSPAIDDIEKDLNRSLPEYAGFQDREGIGRLRRVLTAYSWANPDVGYCQAMNIVGAALLIYASEEQAFHVLSVLCNQLVPGYYSTTMYGTLLDQEVFEALVAEKLPLLKSRLERLDVQLSIVSLPWFLSLFINSMPLVFAFRVLDVFFLEGPKVLFQIGLAILYINEADLMEVSDHAALVSVLKNYFLTLDESAHPDSSNRKSRSITKFQQLMVVAFKDFASITHAVISSQRDKLYDSVLDNIESFAKKAAIRNVGPVARRLAPSELEAVYVRFFGVLHERAQRLDQIELGKARQRLKSRTPASALFQPSTEVAETVRVGLGPGTSRMDYDTFREFLAQISWWAAGENKDMSIPPNSARSRTGSMRQPTGAEAEKALEWGPAGEPADHDFITRLFNRWDTSHAGTLSFSDVAEGVGQLRGSRDIIANIGFFFSLYDQEGTGRVDREGILLMSEALLFLARIGIDNLLPARAESSEVVLGEPTQPSDVVVSRRRQSERSNPDTDGIDPTDDDEDDSDAFEIVTPISARLPHPGQPEDDVNRDGQFLSTVSNFIHRCFQYADPDKAKQNQPKETSPEPDLLNELDDLLLTDSPPRSSCRTRSRTRSTSRSRTTPTCGPKPQTCPLSLTADELKSQAQKAANVALDPANPLVITLPTFRMLVLADELLEQFFECGFANSMFFGATPDPPTGATTGLGAFAAVAAGGASSSNGPNLFNQVPSFANSLDANKGLRNIIDGLVTNGIRVAAEVRKQMDEAQREIERGLGDRRGQDAFFDSGADLLENAETEIVDMRKGKGKSRADQQF